ncbi:hypothetical protein VTK26DRAFT_5553 [Humicola hyalothermophila]
MVQKLCTHYGPYIGSIEGEQFHDFPGPEALSGEKVEGHLRELGFGYRAKYIAETACIVTTKYPKGWLLQLRNPDCPALDAPLHGEEQKVSDAGTEPATYRAAHDALLQLPGVGPKVADCVCLMGLGWGEAVPIDTHVWQIAQRDYGFGKGGKSSKTLTKAMYDAVGDHFRKIWGPQAGWAQSVLFTANLKSFAEQASPAAGRTVAAAATRMEATAAASPSESTISGASFERVVVATEEGADNATARPTKRKRQAKRQASVGEGSCEFAQPEIRPRRTSKRLRARVMSTS